MISQAMFFSDHIKHENYSSSVSVFFTTSEIYIGNIIYSLFLLSWLIVTKQIYIGNIIYSLFLFSWLIVTKQIYTNSYFDQCNVFMVDFWIIYLVFFESANRQKGLIKMF
jgi:hypothetical protein